MSGDFLDLKDKTVLITGATSGIGKAAALAFAAQKVKLVLTGRNAEAGRVVLHEVKEKGSEAVFLRSDSSDEQQVIELIQKSESLFGGIDIAFNNAGFSGNLAPLAEQPLENFTSVLNTNVTGVFLSMKYEVQSMLARNKGGVIINNASMGGLIGFQNMTPYIASKHAVLGLTKTAALEYFSRGIRINAVCPGIIDTPFHDGVWPSRQAFEEFAVQSAPGRAGTPEEVADAVLYLASSRSSFINGHGLVVDGGFIVA